MLVFFGTSRHSALFLEHALQNGLKVDLVVSSPSKLVGKKQILTENPTVTIAKKHNFPYLTSIFQLQDPASNLYRPSSSPNLGLILDFNKIIPSEIINLFDKGIINIHFSKLPQYRGPAPVQYTILNGNRQAWITYYLINERLDVGQTLTQTSLPLDMTETTETLYQKLIEKSSSEIVKIIDNYLSDRYHTCQQIGEASYTKKLTTDNCKINWTKPPIEIERLIRAAYPKPGAWTSVQISPKSAKIPTKKRIKILKAHLESGKLVLDQVQLEGKNPVTWKQFQEGYPSASLF